MVDAKIQKLDNNLKSRIDSQQDRIMNMVQKSMEKHKD